ncbi:hypothetical protein [Streptomyces hygroscopicus]|uniref:hypothetical protein n=1 Tax=Streptomyces hygroscopicus TaxID=1912 RepID=UPI000784535B|nr:hypothetical protein [Streptomyces hygroscopicus]
MSLYPNLPLPGLPDLFIDPPSPKKTAGAFHTTSAAGQNKTKLDDAEAAGTSHAGWAVAKPNQECVTAWRDRLLELGESARKAAAAITDAMDDYMDTDLSVEAALRRDARWLEGA